jgi:hypothetical protein
MKRTILTGAKSVLYTDQPERFGAKYEGVTIIPFFTDPDGSADMNINVAFGGDPEIVHNGIDTVAWAASVISGTWTFNATTHAKNGIITVVDYTGLSGDTITIEGTNITNTTLTEGVNFNAVTSNEVTASNIQSAVDAIAGVNATVLGAIVTVVADNATTEADITTMSTTAGADMTATAQSLDGSATSNGNEALLEDGTSIDMSNFSAITFSILLDKWSDIQNNEIELRARLSGVDVGIPLNVSTEIDTANLGVWQEVAVSKSVMGLNSQTIDEFVIKTIANTGEPNAPDYYIDKFQIEETGSPVTFTVEPPPGFQFHYQRQEVIFEITSAKTVLAPNEFITLPRLPIGIISILTKDNVQAVSTSIRDNYDLIAVGGGSFQQIYADGSAVWGKIIYEVGLGSENGAVILRSSRGDRADIRINDDMSGLDRFRVLVYGQIHEELL